MSEPREYNLQFLKKSRLKKGDIFAMNISKSYVFGRVIEDELSFENSPFGGSYLVYIYSIRSSSKSTDYSELSPSRLLIPPMYVSNALWARGYAEKVAHFDISDEDLLRQHCFYAPSRQMYVNEKGNEIPAKIEPCGEWTYITGLGYIDNKISDALDIKRAPMTEDDMWYLSGKGEKIWLTKPLSELKKYTNYEEVIKQYPQIVER